MELLRSSARAISHATDLKLTIDGVKVHNLKRFYEESELIKVALPADNIFGVCEGKRIDPGVDAGDYVAISGLLAANTRSLGVAAQKRSASRKK